MALSYSKLLEELREFNQKPVLTLEDRPEFIVRRKILNTLRTLGLSTYDASYLASHMTVKVDQSFLDSGLSNDIIDESSLTTKNFFELYANEFGRQNAAELVSTTCALECYGFNNE